MLAGRTHVEVFFVFNDPEKELCFSSDGVWIEALRFLFNNGNISGTKIVSDAVSEVTQCCFDIANHKYEVVGGAASYGGATKTFELTEYIDGSLGFVNCYDQTYAVIVFSAALGMSVDGLFLEPFGFINTVDLVGWGPCNNPFPHGLPVKNYLIVDVKDPYRSGFGNHMFCEFITHVYDACAGPAKGSVGRSGYVSATIDTLSTPRGTSADILSIASTKYGDLRVSGVQ